MPRPYRRGKRIIYRRSDGRFHRPSLAELGFDVANGEMQCAQCGHRWYPVLRSGYCPECNSQEKVQKQEQTE